MEITNSLLVAMMFILVLSIGIGNILMGLALLFDRRKGHEAHWILVSWLVLLLLQHLNLFWQTLDILDVEEWGFRGFLFVITGPILLFLATCLVLPAPEDEPSDDPLALYFKVSRRFFLTLAGLAAWMIGVDLVLAKEVNPATGWAVAELALFVVLASSPHRRLHAAGTLVAWVLFLSLIVARGFGYA